MKEVERREAENSNRPIPFKGREVGEQRMVEVLLRGRLAKEGR